MDIKYTSDGKKVAILGKLNAQQFIVQEIFVTGGQEVPSGENFVVSSLHDQPAESWKEKNIRELEQRYERDKKTLQAAMDDISKRINVARAKAKERCASMLAFAKNSDESQLQTLYDFLAGDITHFFIAGYSPEIVTWDDNKVYDTDSWHVRLKVEGIKLVSLVGKSDGDLAYRLHQYRDGSGGTWTTVVPCRSYQEALACAQEALDEQASEYVAGKRRTFSPGDWEKIEGIEIPQPAIEKHNAEKQAHRDSRIKKLRDELSQLESETHRECDQ